MSRHSIILDHAVICGLCRCQTVFYGCAIVFRVMVVRFTHQCLFKVVIQCILVYIK